MKMPFSIRDIIATPGYVRLPYDPVSPVSPIKGPKTKRSRLSDFLRRERRKSEGYNFLRNDPYPQRRHSAHVGSLEIVDTLHMERFTLMRKRRPLSSIGFGKRK